MTRRQIKLLAQASYVRNNLDSIKCNKIADKLTREDFKRYLRILKTIEREKTVTVIVPEMTLGEKQNVEKRFGSMFKDKRIQVETDQSLVVGLKIIDNDLVYELSLRDTISRINNYLLEQYD